MKQNIIIVSTNDWHGFWFQRQEFATRFAAEGRKVLFINKIPQRIPKPGRVFRLLLSRKKNGKAGGGIYNSVPDGVTVITPFILPPFRFLRPLNRLLWKRKLGKLPYGTVPENSVLITYQPTYNVIDLVNIVKPSKIVYVNTHNYNADPSCPADLLRSEKELAGNADVLLADSGFNLRRLKAYNPPIKVERAMPGVDVRRFAVSFRGDELEKRKKIMFFGDIGRHLDISVYNDLAEEYEITFIGIVDKAIAGQISDRIRILPPVAPRALPEVLRDADILTIFYKSSGYVDGILPAKFFECLATGKPLLVSGLPEADVYKECIHDIEGSSSRAFEILENLSRLETESVRIKREKTASEADWENRFNQFSEKVFGL